MSTRILRIDSSARTEGSISRRLADSVIERFANAGEIAVNTRDLNDALPHVTETWIGANFTDEAERNDIQRAALAKSDQLVAEIKAADVLVIGLPIYNFGVPASLKAWIDLVARRGITFEYTENGPKGLLSDKRAIVAVASGGTEVGSDIDFATGYLRHVLGFIGITDVIFVNADRLAVEPEATLKAAEYAIAALPVAA